MSGCSTGQLEAYLDGELAPHHEATARAHIGGCTACQTEVAWLRAERRAFVARAQADDATLPPFGAVWRRARRPQVRAPLHDVRERTSPLPETRSFWRSAFERAIPLGAAAAVAIAVLGAMRETAPPNRIHAHEAPAVVAEPDEGVSRSPAMTCSRDEEETLSDAGDEAEGRATPRSVVTGAKRVAPEIEDAFAACLMPAAAHDDARALCVAPQP